MNKPPLLGTQHWQRVSNDPAQRFALLKKRWGTACKHSRRQNRLKKEIVSIIVATNTASAKLAMVISSQYTSITDKEVPWPWRYENITNTTKHPRFGISRCRIYCFLNTCVCQNQVNVVARSKNVASSTWEMYPNEILDAQQVTLWRWRTSTPNVLLPPRKPCRKSR